MDLELPVVMVAGQTNISIRVEAPAEPTVEPTVEQPTDAENLRTIDALPLQAAQSNQAVPPDGPLERISESAAAQLDRWLQRIIALQQAGAGSAEFYRETAQALIELLGMDLGLVLLLRHGTWSIAGSAVSSDRVTVRYSKTLLGHVVKQRRTFFEDLESLGGSAASLADIECGVAAPIFGLEEDVVGVLYGVRTHLGLAARGAIEPLEAQLVQLLAAAAGANLARSVAQRTRVQFEQFFSPDLVRELERDADLLEGRTEEVTVLFSDLRGFTTLSEKLGPHKTCHMLRDMMEQLSERIVGHGGVIVDYAGDGILAMWNAPVKQADHAARACSAALAMLDELPALNARWSGDFVGTLKLGIGINTGEALVGNTGSHRKFKYGPHGHTVNVASRVQDATKRLKLPLLITESTRACLPAEFFTRRIGRIVLPGVAQPVVAFELSGRHGSAEWIRLRDTYEAALALFEAGQWARACQALTPLLDANGEKPVYDWPTLRLMRRAWDCLETRPDPFDPIIEVSSK
jgi:adenylate cyclase